MELGFFFFRLAGAAIATALLPAHPLALLRRSNKKPNIDEFDIQRLGKPPKPRAQYVSIEEVWIKYKMPIVLCAAACSGICTVMIPQDRAKLLDVAGEISRRALRRPYRRLARRGNPIPGGMIPFLAGEPARKIF